MGKYVRAHSCEGCRYWRPLSATDYMACHYLLDNGHMRGGKVSDCTVREETEANEIKKPRFWRDGKENGKWENRKESVRHSRV